MNWIRIACSLVLCSLFTAVSVQRAHASVLTQEEPKAHQPAPEMQQPEPKPETPEATPEQPEKQENAKPETQEKDETKDLTKEQKKEQNKERKHQSKENKKQQKTNAAADNGSAGSAKMQGKGVHIPDDKFRANFGRNHTFVINRPVIVNNQPTFHYGGYSFVMVDPWPMGWAYTDDCYIDYIDGEYFLFDLLHPGVRIEVFVNA